MRSRNVLHDGKISTLGPYRLSWKEGRAMTDKWIGPRVVGGSEPPADGYDYVRRYAEDVRLAAGSGTTVENEHVAGHVAFRRDWMRRHGLRAESCSLVEVTGDSMEPDLFDGDSALVDHSRRDPVEGAIFALRTLDGPLVKRLRFHDERWWASSDNDSPQNPSRPLDADDRIIGRVVWYSHGIVEGEPQPASE